MTKDSYEKTEAVAKKADNPTPQNNPELKKICDQFREVREQIEEEIDDAIAANDMKAVIELLKANPS